MRASSSRPCCQIASAKSWPASRGLGDREIAEQLVLSPHTVHRDVANIRRKLGRPSRTAAVADVARLGLL
ncbi:MAG: LuxR C-terminal-related transcriptional regulator [Mycobacterium sp.]